MNLKNFAQDTKSHFSGFYNPLKISYRNLVQAVNSFQIVLNTSAEQFVRLQQLQTAFAAVCNAIAPVASGQRCWNRVALHHLTYKDMRARFPEMGSQMVCNAIYSVCKMSRLVYQHPDSPFNVKRLGVQKLPTLKFSDTCPVYFDSHTLTLDESKLSMYTLDGRMKFMLTLTPLQQQALKAQKLGEIHLNRNTVDQYALTFIFSPSKTDPLPESASDTQVSESSVSSSASILKNTMNVPTYVELESSP
ncbi:MAG: hypothetical protein RLZZ612_1727 [Pseudomonadota bacterium]|jgi:hypothetical protein